MSKEKTGLVLEGGAMRGIYTAGVLDEFMEAGITFDGVIGVSAGALHGCSFVSEQKGRSLRYYMKYRSDRHFMSFWNLLRTGDVVDKKFCYHDIPERLDPYDYEAFLKSRIRFYAVCTNLETGKAEYLPVKNMRSQVDIMRASASMPYVSRIVEYRGMKLLDGGCADSIPVMAFRRMGYEKNVVVLTRHDGYVKKPENPKLIRAFYHKYPNFVRTLTRRHLVYNRTIENIHRLEKEGSVFVIRPSVELTIGRMEKDPEKIREVYEIGRKDAKSRMEALKKWMEKNE